MITAMKTMTMIVIKCIHAIVKYNIRPLFYIRIYIYVLYCCIIIHNIIVIHCNGVIKFWDKCFRFGFGTKRCLWFLAEGQTRKKINGFRIYIYNVYLVYTYLI